MGRNGESGMSRGIAVASEAETVRNGGIRSRLKGAESGLSFEEKRGGTWAYIGRPTGGRWDELFCETSVSL